MLTELPPALLATVTPTTLVTMAPAASPLPSMRSVLFEPALLPAPIANAWPKRFHTDEAVPPNTATPLPEPALPMVTELSVINRPPLAMMMLLKLELLPTSVGLLLETMAPPSIPAPSMRRTLPVPPLLPTLRDAPARFH